MAEQNQYLQFIGGLADKFAEVRIAESQAELNSLDFVEGDVTRRPETVVDESAASQRNFFGLATTEQQNRLLLGGAVLAVVIVGLGAAALLRK